MKTLLTGAVAAAAAIVFLCNGASAQTVEEILAKADETLTKVTDLTYDADMQVVRDGKVIKTIKFVAKLKGLKKRLVKFTAPGDVRGMSILTTEDGLMYVYMPAYKRVRRVASHVENQGFMGSDISPEDLASAAWSVNWKGKLKNKDDDEAKKWIIVLKPKSGYETNYSKQIIHVDKSFGGVVKVKSFNKRGKLVKTQTRSKVKSFGPIKMPTHFVYKDELTGSKTILRFHSCKVNQGISDKAFSKRALMQGR